MEYCEWYVEKTVLVSQRRDTIDGRDEVRDALDA